MPKSGTARERGDPYIAIAVIDSDSELPLKLWDVGDKTNERCVQVTGAAHNRVSVVCPDCVKTAEPKRKGSRECSKSEIDVTQLQTINFSCAIF